MTMHELQYCRHLLQLVKDLYIERAALSAFLDMPSRSASSASPSSWHTTCQQMAADPVFRSAVEANFAPYFDRLERGLRSPEAFSNPPASMDLTPH